MDLIIPYPKLYSIYLRGTIASQCLSLGGPYDLGVPCMEGQRDPNKWVKNPYNPCGNPSRPPS